MTFIGSCVMHPYFSLKLMPRHDVESVANYNNRAASVRTSDPGVSIGRVRGR
jgi:hypothetical protein